MDESAKRSIRELFGEDFSKILEAYEDKLKSLQKLCNKYENEYQEEVRCDSIFYVLTSVRWQYAYAVLLENRCRDYANLLLEVLSAIEAKPNSPLATPSIPLLEPLFYRLRQKITQRKEELLQLLRDLIDQDHRKKFNSLSFEPIGNAKAYKVANSPRNKLTS